MAETEGLILLESRYSEAEELIENPDQLERLLQRIEEKLKIVPVAGETLSNIPVMISLVRSCVKGDYSDLPVGSLIAIVSALIYFLSPIDFIPDSIPGVGLIDDALVVSACLKLVQSDMDEYKAWRAAR